MGSRIDSGRKGACPSPPPRSNKTMLEKACPCAVPTTPLGLAVVYVHTPHVQPKSQSRTRQSRTVRYEMHRVSSFRSKAPPTNAQKYARSAAVEGGTSSQHCRLLPGRAAWCDTARTALHSAVGRYRTQKCHMELAQRKKAECSGPITGHGMAWRWGECGERRLRLPGGARNR